jgi:Omp85 superfamily domain
MGTLLIESILSSKSALSNCSSEPGTPFQSSPDSWARLLGLRTSSRSSLGRGETGKRALLILATLLSCWGGSLQLLAEDATPSRQEEWQQRRETKSQEVKTNERNSVERGALYVQKERLLEKLAEGWKSFHPVFGGMSTGSGFAGGVRYEPRLANGAVYFGSSGAISTRVYQKYDLAFGAPRLLGGKLFANFYARYRSSPQEDFFGVGPDSREQDRTNFAQEDSLFDFTVGWNWTRWLTTGARVGYLKTNIGRGTDKRFPSTGDVFSPAEFPELINQPNYYHTDAFVSVDYRDEPLNAHAGGFYLLNYAYYDDQKLNLYTYRRLDAEFQQYFPFLKKKRVIAFRAHVSLADTSAGQSIPFYMMPSDASALLRGYREFRFRDRNFILMNLEYRWEAFSGLDLAIFGDAGKVASRRSDVNFKDLESDVGFGFRFNTIKSVFLRIDIGFSHEGTRVFFKFAPAF